MIRSLQAKKQPVPYHRPSSLGFKAWTEHPLIGMQSTAAQASQQLNVVRIPVEETFTCTLAVIFITSAGSGLTYSRIALFDGTNTQLSISADQTGVWNATGKKEIAMPSCTVVGGVDKYVYAAILNVGTTPPTMARSNATSTLSGLLTMLGRGGSSPFFYCGTASGQATIGSSLPTMAADNNTFFVGLA